MNLKATTIAISSLFVCTTLWAGEFASQTIRLAHTAAVSHGKLFKSTLNNRLHRNLACVIDKSSRSAKLKRAFEELP